MVLGSTQPLTGMSTRNLPGGKGWATYKADLIAICEPIVQKMWEPRRLTTVWASTACYRGSFTLRYIPGDKSLQAVVLFTPACAPELSSLPYCPDFA
jgi:hypothetical protein